MIRLAAREGWRLFCSTIKLWDVTTGRELRTLTGHAQGVNSIAYTLDLMKVLRARLRDEGFVTARGASQPVLLFVDDEEFPGDIRPTGRYTVAGNEVTVTLRLRRDGVEIASSLVRGTKDDFPGLAARILEAVREFIGKS